MTGWAPRWLPQTLLIVLLLLAIAVLALILLVLIDVWSITHDLAGTGGGD